MRNIIRRFIRSLMQSPRFRLIYWYFRAPFSNYAAFAFFKERTARDLRTNGEYLVRFGPYRGMKYTKHGTSVSINCLLGTYEMEIWPVIESVKNHDYDYIIDVGCAEGFHACGLAKTTGKQVYAYDTDENARIDCAVMARINGLENQLEIGSYLSTDDLQSMCADNRVFVFCDIDYHELQLLDLAKVPALQNADILVETHGHAPGSPDDTLPVLLSRFSETHEIKHYQLQPRQSFMFWDLLDQTDEKNKRFHIGKVVDEPLCHAFFEERGWNNWLFMKSKLGK